MFFQRVDIDIVALEKLKIKRIEFKCNFSLTNGKRILEFCCFFFLNWTWTEHV